MRKVIRIALVIIVILLLGIVACNLAVTRRSAAHIYSSLDALPKNKVGLVLGTSKYLRDGSENLFFKYRLQAAADLYIAGKIEHIIVSGDNRMESYNEPRVMKRELVKLGVPPEKVHFDFAGFRTLDSVIRCKEVFGQNQFTVISQKFHNERALFIARRRGIDAIAFNARDVDPETGLKTRLREILARVMVVFDLYVLNTQPKFLGEKIEIQ
ncbi:MAG TPA: ElyC/SanA/YdcF family protein [Chitinophagales bacterium]|nr:ElyC/SanA/YdcF family protein [Chitinophagales bacterium]